MLKRMTNLSALTAASLLLCAAPVLALPQKAAPQGMRAVSTGGVGRILTTHMSGTSSARKMLTALKMVSREYFDGPITVTRAFADPSDQNAQAAFTAKLKGTPVHGVASVMLNGDNGQATLLFDDAGTFSKSFRTLVAKQNGGGGKGGAKLAQVSLTRRTAPDGSCQVSLPDGFRIADSYKGTLDIVGPNGAYMGLGCPAVCTRPEAAGMFPNIPPVNFSNPVQAMIDHTNYIARKAGKEVSIKIWDAKPVPGWTAGRAAFIRYTINMDGKATEGFGLFSIAQTDVNQALFYSSFINSSPSMYRKQFPAMLQAWATYSINPSVFRERLMAAAESMRGISDIIQSSNDYKEKVDAQVNEAWDDYIRDQGTWSNPTTGNRYKISTSATNVGIPMQNGVALQPVPTGQL